MNVAALRDGVGMSHEHYEAASFTGQEARGPLVVDAHPVDGQRAGPRKTHQFERVERKVDASCEGHVQIARHQGRAGLRHGQKGRCAGAIHGKSATMQPEVIADAPGNGVGQTSGEAFLAGYGKRLLVVTLQCVEQGSASVGLPALRLEHGIDLALDVGPPKAHLARTGELTRERVAHQHAGVAAT